MNCTSVRCPTAAEKKQPTAEADFSCVWPGKGRVYYCSQCFRRLLVVATGLGLSVESLDVQEHGTDRLVLVHPPGLEGAEEA